MDTDEFETDDHLVKDLRKQLNEAIKARKQFEEELTSIKSQFRERSVAEILTAKGVNAKVAKFIPSDIESEDQVQAWLQENADLFGAPVVEEQGSPVSEQVRGELQRANQLQERSAPPDKINDLEQRLAVAGSVDEINAVLAEYQKYQL